jgi:hypothetical protein
VPQDELAGASSELPKKETVKTRTWLGRTARLATAGVALAGVAALAMAASSRGARSELAVPDPAPDADAVGDVSVKHFDARGRHGERSWIRVRARHLDRKTEYSLWMDDPSTEGDATTVQFGSFTTNGGGNINQRIDTKAKGRNREAGSMPFGSTLDALAGLPFEIRNAAGDVVLAGSFPDTTPE